MSKQEEQGVHVVTEDELPELEAKWKREDEEKLMKQEMNEALATWAGFQKRGVSYRGQRIWVAPEEVEHFDKIMAEQEAEGKEYCRMPAEDCYYVVPEFTDSLDECFEYLVPKLEGCDRHEVWTVTKGWGYVLFFGDTKAPEVGVGETPALALCRVIRSYIERQQ